MKKETRFSFFWKVGQVWWLIFTPIFFMFWLSPLLAGLMAKKRSWVIWAVLYAASVFLLFAVAPQPESTFRNMAILVFLFSWFGCFIHSVFIARDYLKIVIAKLSGRPIARQKKLGREEEKQLVGLSIKHKRIMHVMLLEKKEILESYNKIDPILQNSMLDILEMVETYVDYARDLMTKEEEIAKIIQTLNITNIENKIKQLKHNISKTSNIELKNEYLNTIDNYQKQKETYKDFIEKKEIIHLKLESNIIKLREIKYDLIEMSYKVSETEKNNIFKKVNELTDDMSDFISTIKETFNELKD